MSKNNDYHYFIYLDIAFLVTMLLMYLYVIAYRLRFHLDKAAYVILLTQLVSMSARILLTFDAATILDSFILVWGYSITQGCLYYFIFEMKYIAIKIQSQTLEVFKAEKKRTKRAKALVMIGLFGIFTPLMTASLIMSISNLALDKYWVTVLALNIVARIPIILSEIYIYFTFITVFRFFIKKKKEILYSQNNQTSLSARSKFNIGCVIALTTLKIIETPTLIINGMWYQLTLKEDRTELQKQLYQFFTMCFIAVNDFLIAMAILYFYYFQSLR